MTHPQDFREQLPELLDEHAPKRAPGHLFDRFAESMDDAPQRPGWATRERWFPMDSSVHVGQARRLAMMVAALLLLALALAAAFVAGSRLLADPMTIIVAADGSGHVTTLGEGIDRARNGDTVYVRPGTYVEVVAITKDLEIRGDGPQESIIIRATDEGPSSPTAAIGSRPAADQRFAILIDQADTLLTGLTFRGEHSAVVAIGGAPTIEDNYFEGVGPEPPHEVVAGKNAIVVSGGSSATIRGNQVVGSGPIAAFDQSEPLIEGNELSGGAHIMGGFGSAAEIRDNRVEWSVWGIEFRGAAAPVIEANSITEVEYPIRVEGGSAIIRGNQIQHASSNDTGIQYDDGSGTIEGNTVEGYTRGVAVTDFSGEISGNVIDAGFDGVHLTDSTGTIGDNQITAVFTGISLTESSPDVVDNRIEGSANGVSVTGAGSAPTFSGNELCGTTRPLATSDGAARPDLAGLGGCAES